MVLTADKTWDPSVADHEFNKDNNFDYNFPDNHHVHDPKFDPVGNYNERVIHETEQDNFQERKQALKLDLEKKKK